MFNWIWEILYSISKTLFRLIDGLIICANKLCGIETINFDGEEMDFLSYLFYSDEIGFAFRVSALIGTILLFIFATFMIIRSIAKDKAEGTPAQIAVKAFKTLLMFCLVPAVIIAFMTIGNAFVEALYGATMQSAATPGTFLFCAFAQDGGMKPEYVELFRVGELDYTSTNVVSTYMNLSYFPFFFSYIAGGVVLFGIGSAMLMFVDRVLALVILYIAAPISLSTSVLDDGARFKLWRDQFLTKFIMGYGMILAINIYALVCGLVTKRGFAFFPGEDTWTQFLDLVMKLLIIAGGALTLQKAMAIAGNLVSQGAGSNELRDSVSAGSIARMAKGIAGGVAGKALTAAGYLTGGKAIKSILGDAISMQSRHLGGRLLNGLHLGGGGGGDKDKKDSKDSDDSKSKNNEKPDYGSGNSTKNAINGDEGFKTSFGGNSNNSSSKKQGGDAVNNAINNGGQSQGNQNGQSNKNTQNNNKQEGGENK